MTPGPDLAVILAAGRGTRMQADAAVARGLDDPQRALAARGLKMLVPVAGRPFIAWVLDAVAEAGFAEVCLVLGDHTAAVRDALHDTRLRFRFTEQASPRGTADAVLSAERVVAGRPFAVINADNHYPAGALRALRETSPPATIGFARVGPAGAFALMRTDTAGCLREIVEKPDAADDARLGPEARVSMTCWSFPPAIFEHCRAVAPSARGELELPDAVRRLAAVTCLRVLPHPGPVLDLGTAADIPAVVRSLAP